jgi:hypothetical protein
MPYLLDANVFIQAKNLHYGMDFCPGFWDWLVERNRAGDVLSIERVGDELAAGADELETWAAGPGRKMFVRSAPAVLPSLQAVSGWVVSQTYEQAAVNTFLQVADFFLVAEALAGQHTVVTHEVASPSTKKIKIPNVCLGLGVKCINPFEMLRRERARFVLPGGRNEPAPERLF